MKPTETEKSEFKKAMFFPVLFVFLFWAVKFFEWFSGTSLETWGIYPKRLTGLIGILFAPFIHGDIWHLLNNSIPFLVLGTALFYFYKKVAFTVFSLVWVVTGLCVWIAGRSAYHIGASGVIYGLASFLFFSGLFRRKIKLLAISLLITFLYGSMIWGIFPLFKEVSWESHLFGALAGLAFAFVYSKEINTTEIPVEVPDEEYDFPFWEVTDENENSNPQNPKNDAYNADQIIR